MIKTLLIFRAMGTAFSPSAAEKQTGLLFSKKNEPGDIGKWGRYKEQPIPYGSAELCDPTEDSDLFALSPVFFRTLELLVPACRAALATSIVLHADLAFEDQCNIEMSEDFIQALAGLRIPFTMTCYENRE